MDAASPLTTARRIAALSVAVVADILQLPLMLALVASAASVVGLGAAVPLEAVDVVVDVFTACVTSWLLGFHWVLLPTVFLEAVPGLAAAPTWTGCVLFVIWRRRQQAAAVRPPLPPPADRTPGPRGGTAPPSGR